MFETKIVPRLPAAAALARKTIHTFGTGESDIGEALADLMTRGRSPAVGTTAEAGVIAVRIVAGGKDETQARAAAVQTAEEVRRRLGDLVFGEDGDTLAVVAGRALRAAGQTLAAAESCTGGMVGEMVTAESGASEYFLGGIVSYANSAKMDLLGMPAELIQAEGAVSEAVAAAMAEGARARFGSDWALGITGVAGPTGGSAEKPVGLVYIAVASAADTAVHRHHFSGDRATIRRRAALTALNHLRLAMRGSS